MEGGCSPFVYPFLRAIPLQFGAAISHVGADGGLGNWRIFHTFKSRLSAHRAGGRRQKKVGEKEKLKEKVAM